MPIIQTVIAATMMNPEALSLCLLARKGQLVAASEGEDSGPFCFPRPHSERHQEPAWAARKETQAGDTPLQCLAAFSGGTAQDWFTKVIQEASRLNPDRIGALVERWGRSESIGLSPLGIQWKVDF